MITTIMQMNENKRMFRQWLEKNSLSEDDDYKDHAAQVLYDWLNQNLVGHQIGNLFRFDNPDEYDSFKEMIVSLPGFARVNDCDANGRPNAALNHYSNYLRSFEPGELKRKIEKIVPSNGCRTVIATFPLRRG